jgi:hypothetical protein
MASSEEVFSHSISSKNACPFSGVSGSGNFSS